MARSKGRPRHVPLRTCLAYRTRGDKRSLIRLVYTPDRQVLVDPTGRHPGRGAYLCANRACWEQALKRRVINRALRTVLTAEEASQLRQYAQGLPASVEEVVATEEVPSEQQDPS